MAPRATKLSASRSKRSTVFGPASGIVGDVFRIARAFVVFGAFDAGLRCIGMIRMLLPRPRHDAQPQRLV